MMGETKVLKVEWNRCLNFFENIIVNDKRN
jgi:hypothetical protein